MKKSVVSFVAAAAIVGTAAANVQAEEVTVKKGDTLWGISQKYDATVEQVKNWNGLSSDIIFPEDVLDVYEKEKYKVNKGDTLWNIAKEYDVSVSSIKEWNNLNSDVIHPEQKLEVYPGAPDNIKIDPPKPKETEATPVTSEPVQEPVKQEPIKQEPVEQKPKTEKPAETVEAPKAENKEQAAPEEGTKELTMEATAYTATCEGCSGVTATGINLLENPDMKVISVDPNVIPLGSKVYVEGYGEAIAGDTGGAIKGNKIDVFIPNKDDAINFGRQTLKVTILD
ncbi:LysM peptidoglycan-binding and 3D domain-containing protein [Cytobacillus horneckiae]|uniref:Peptidoglycan-binding protein n=1 Tax=Cytobacillus horneckiae TaxID=549687 RepID=A0A2N0ZI23_9BACI|nr:3D domain-containing protein [Cytobacillus horneckiae]MCM3177669.1 LysM peptidoglycan-binding domain-containing protein [Cytobacillus horneckiae]MEC1157977.1 LysM peptidoglycan-binding domain-containing protein [Cytobacillus horneckiae]MED2937098.1 LysM peptidoglycan-binding domain-containing protein [Cytobacillus horneckiae]PKG29153.1 peptidoglycan-binding protein [Cytobacillus horneckiae]